MRLESSGEMICLLEIALKAQVCVSCVRGARQFYGGPEACSPRKVLKFALCKALEMHSQVHHFGFFMLLAENPCYYGQPEIQVTYRPILHTLWMKVQKKHWPKFSASEVQVF